MFPTTARRFALPEITSGLPDDSRETDEHEEVRHLRDLRGRVKAARAVVSRTPGLAGTLASDWQKAVRFYARFGMTEERFRHGVPATPPEAVGPEEEGQNPSAPGLLQPGMADLTDFLARSLGSSGT